MRCLGSKITTTLISLLRFTERYSFFYQSLLCLLYLPGQVFVLDITSGKRATHPGFYHGEARKIFFIPDKKTSGNELPIGEIVVVSENGGVYSFPFNGKWEQDEEQPYDEDDALTIHRFSAACRPKDKKKGSKNKPKEVGFASVFHYAF